jgi:polyphosphate kinase 2 (PPK2 family)
MGYLDKLDLDKKLETKAEYEDLLQEYQLRLLKLQRKIIGKEIAVCIAYEGEDAAGKGGNIKRLTEALDPRGFEVYPIGAPSSEDRGPLATPFLVTPSAPWPLWNLRSHLVRPGAS